MLRIRIALPLLLICILPYFLIGQTGSPFKTPLSQEVLDRLTDEISGQIIFNNEVMLAGAPWMRNAAEFTDTFYESDKIHKLVLDYGITTTRLDRFESDRTFDYPVEGEFWLLEPEKRRIARLEADAALIASGSESVDVTSKLIYLPNLTKEQMTAWMDGSAPEDMKGKIALMWSHPRGDAARALDAAGLSGVVSFYARDRYFDPDQVVYARGAYKGLENLKVGLTISWRQWSELLEDLEKGKDLTVRCKTRVETHQDKFENVFSWIPGTEPGKKGVIFSAHLFEGYTKRGANDNMSGCVIQLEILRALSKLIRDGQLPRPRRNIYFLWINEISGTYKHFEMHPGFADKLSININMDMVGEALSKNNGVFTMSECPNHLPSYLDGLAESILNYVWRTNDIVYLPDSPRGRSGQFFPSPIWEKNGSRDAFRYFVHRATGGSDHICFNNPAVAVPGIEFFVWPDQWYHADTDTPDKSDPTEMRRVAFIGASAAYAAANCTDEVLAGLVDAVSDFGYARIGKRELPKALNLLDHAHADGFDAAYRKAYHLATLAADREIGALESIREIDSGSKDARLMLDNRIKQWSLYKTGIENQILAYAKLKASQMNLSAPQKMEMTAEEKKYDKIIPAIHPDVKGKIFYAERSEPYQKYMKDHPDAMKEIKMTRRQQRSFLNFVNGKNSVTKIRNWAVVETGKDLAFDDLVKALDILKKVKYITY